MTDPFDIIEGFHEKKKKMPRFCNKCKGHMSKKGIRTSASVNYMVWNCSKCGSEELDFVDLADNIKKDFKE